MHLGSQLFLVMVLTTFAGWSMVELGVAKRLLERKRSRRICPSCGRDSDTCLCKAG